MIMRLKTLRDFACGFTLLVMTTSLGAQTLPGVAAFTVTPRAPFRTDGGLLGYAISAPSVAFETLVNAPTGFINFGGANSEIRISIEPRARRFVHFVCEFVGDVNNPVEIAWTVRDGRLINGRNKLRVGGPTTGVFSSDMRLSGVGRTELSVTTLAGGKLNFHKCQVRFS